MCLVDELERGGGQFQWGDGPSQIHGECATHSGERETQELTRYQGKNGSQWNGEGAWERRGPFRISRPEEVIQRNWSFPSGVRGNESVPRWVVSIEVSEDESVREVRKDVRIEGPGARSEGLFLMGGE